ncbi:MAG: ATP-binding cassette domain-containing protein, partial [Clostridia bacterium]|nr:ATP-binding cassette domain-containing protein [Clostridia bacterium]
MLKVNNLYLRYTREFYALYNINLDIADGEKVAFVGEDESGKTSLLRIFAKSEKLTKGEVFIRDIPIEKLDYKTDLVAGYVPACPEFLEKKSVYENLKYVLKIWGYSDSDIESKINEAIIEYSLEKIKDTKVIVLSKEEKYVLSLIRLTFKNLDFLMIDNIFDDLNETTLEVIISLINQLATKYTTLIVATKKEWIADKLCKRK